VPTRCAWSNNILTISQAIIAAKKMPMHDTPSHDSTEIDGARRNSTTEEESDLRDLRLWELEAIREEHRRDEAMVLALGWTKYLMGFFLIAESIFQFAYHLETYRAVKEAFPPLSAPWVFSGAAIFSMVCFAVLGLAHFPAGYALRGLRGWSITAQVFLFPLWILVTLLCFGTVLHEQNSGKAIYIIALSCILFIIYLIDLYILSGKSIGVLFSFEYKIVVERTRHIKIKRKIPAKIRIIRAVLLLPFVILFMVGIILSLDQE
jgi:hypothetical protein